MNAAKASESNEVKECIKEQIELAQENEDTAVDNVTHTLILSEMIEACKNEGKK